MAFFVPFVVGAASGLVGSSFIKLSSGGKSKTAADAAVLEAENEKLRTRIKEMQEQIDSLVNSNKKHRKESEANDEELEELEDKLKDAEKEIKALKAQLSHSESIIADYKATVARLESELEK